MSADFDFDSKGKVQNRAKQEVTEPQKDGGHLTASDLQGKINPDTVKKMQQTVGNAAVQRFLAQRSESGPSEVDENTAATINSERGSGQALDTGIAQRAEAAMGHDFSGVNVHTGDTADGLSKKLGAKAFTTGSDIFFQSGQYNPGNSSGQELIAHELTHVVQQREGAVDVQGKMTVNDPNDQYEAEADAVAKSVMNFPDEAVAQSKEDIHRQPEAEELEEETAQKKADPEIQRQDEEEPMLKADPGIQRAFGPEDEMAQGKADPGIQLEAMPEDEEEQMAQEKVDPNLQRQEDEEIV